MPSPTKKIRILFVHTQLLQHGSERYFFEICKAIDKDRFDVEVMTGPFRVKRQYYYGRLRELGIRIHRRLFSRRFLVYPIKRLYRRSALVRAIVGWCHRLIARVAYLGFFEQYDVIACVGIETYCDALSPFLDRSARVVIHHVFHEYQFERDYFAECRQRDIVILDTQQEREIRRSALSAARTFMLPLPMSFRGHVGIEPTPYESPEPVRVGVVSRLSPDRPNEPLLRCFAALRKRRPAVLYFYGGGNRHLYDALLDELGIRDAVEFMGHQTDLRAAIGRDRLHMLWLVSMGSSVSYGSIEVASLGMPMVFWNMSDVPTEIVSSETGGAIDTFFDRDAFVDHVQRLLASPDRLRQAGERLQYYVREHFEIANHIHDLEAHYTGIAARDRRWPSAAERDQP